MFQAANVGGAGIGRNSPGDVKGSFKHVICSWCEKTFQDILTPERGSIEISEENGKYRDDNEWP